tara:strand:+ start:37 stop:435 length:399 start_codon:yes stop_codon:yes gene_type:complete
MAYGLVQVDTLETSTQTLNIDSIPTSNDVTSSIVSSLTSWSTLTSATTLAVNSRYFANTSSTAFTLTLPATPSAGQYVTIADSGGNFATNSVTLSRNGSNIVGQANDLVLDVSRTVVTLTYSGNATTGWLVK